MGMPIKNFFELAVNFPPDITILIRGDHGIGKSQLARRIAARVKEKYNLKSYPLFDRRLSQMTEGDLLGMPDANSENTTFKSPDWYDYACKHPCMILLDEMNRATTEVLQAAFQIVLDRELNGKKLHPLTRVISAVNAGGNYNVQEFDPALLDRFWVVDLEPTVEDWLIWAREKVEVYEGCERDLGAKEKFGNFNCNPIVTDFIASDGGGKWLDPIKDAAPGVVQPSRRSWERLGDVLVYIGCHGQPDGQAFFSACVGFLGPETTIAFQNHCVSTSLRFSGADILNNYSKVRKALVSKQRVELFNEAIDKVIQTIIKEDTLTEPQAKNVAAFMKDLPGEQMLALWAKLLDIGKTNKAILQTAHNHCVDIVVSTFQTDGTAVVETVAKGNNVK